MAAIAIIQQLFTAFCNENGVSAIVNLISGVQSHEQVQAFIATLRLIFTGQPERLARLDDLERNLQQRVHEVQLNTLNAEIQTLRGQLTAEQARNQALTDRVAELEATAGTVALVALAAPARPPAPRIRPPAAPRRRAGVGKPGVPRIRSTQTKSPSKRAAPRR